MSLFSELKRRNVLRVATAYVVVAWLVIQVVETIFPAFGFGDTTVRIVTIVFAIGLIPVLILAWAFELTPEGLKKDKDVDRTQTITHQTGKKLDRVIMIVLALALSLFAFDKFVLDPARDAKIAEAAREKGRSESIIESYGDKSIAVLPFTDMSQAGDQQYLSDGLAEELINLLGSVSDLRVTSRSSTFNISRLNLPISELAARLKVNYVLEGSVRLFDDQLRIGVQLIEAGTETQLWSDNYDRKFENIFIIQDDISARVVDALKAELFGTGQPTDIDPEAYALYLKGLYQWNLYTYPSLLEALEYYRQSVARDPDFADAWAELGRVYLRLGTQRVWTYEKSRPLSREALEKALAFDPDHVKAAVRLLMLNERSDVQTFAQGAQDLVDKHPRDFTVLSLAAEVLEDLGRVKEVIALIKYLRLLDPVAPGLLVNLAWQYQFIPEHEESLRYFEEAATLSPENGSIRFGRATALARQGHLLEALAIIETLTLYPNRQNLGLAWVNYELGNQDASNEALARLLKSDSPVYKARAHALRGEIDEAFHWLYESIEAQAGELQNMPVDFWLESLVEDPRWLPFLESIGRSPGQLAAIKFEVKLP